jgi:hypothetical protein
VNLFFGVSLEVSLFEEAICPRTAKVANVVKAKNIIDAVIIRNFIFTKMILRSRWFHHEAYNGGVDVGGNGYTQAESKKTT